MKAYMVKTNIRIEPFDEHPENCLIANRNLHSLQEEALASESISLMPVTDLTSIKDEEEHITFYDYLYFTPEILNEFISRSRALGCRTVAALKRGTSTLRTIAATQSVDNQEDYIGYCLSYVPPESRRNGGAQPVVIDPDQMFEFVPMSKHLFGESEYRVPLTDRLIVQVEHWSNLWAANIATLLAELARLKRRPKLNLLWLALKARSFNQWNVLHQANRIGRRCDIHPTAYIEGSTIGDNVKIGAMAIVRESIIGNNCYIANNAEVELSVIGDGSVLQGGTVVQYSVLYPGAFTFAKGINASFLGRDTFIGDGATLCDFRFDSSSVTVLKDSKMIDTGNTFLGACLGHGAYLGSGCIVAPGRTIPNGARITPENSRLIQKLGASDIAPGYQRVDVPHK